MDFSKYTDEELQAELEAMKLALEIDNGRPFDGRDGRIRMKVAAIQAEMEKRNATRS